MSHDEAVELLGAFALDAVDPDEAAALSLHIEQCPRCSQELGSYREVVSLLASTGGDAPAGVWDHIAERVSREGFEREPSTLPAPAAGGERRSPAATRRRHRATWWGASVGVAAAAVVIALLGVQVSHLENRIGQVEAATEHQGLTQAVQAALLDPRAARVPLAAGNSAGRVVAQIVALPSGEAFLINQAMPSLPSGETYQLWGKVGTNLVSLGLLGNRPGDIAFYLGPSAPVTSYAVTAEHAGGSVRPEGSPVAVSGAI